MEPIIWLALVLVTLFGIYLQEAILANLKDLQDKIDTLPQDTATAVVAAVRALPQPAEVDTQPQIDALNAVPAHVADLVTQALTNPAP